MTASDGPRRRKLSAEERALWRAVTRTIAPLGRKLRHEEAAELVDIDTAAVTAPPAARRPAPAAKPGPPTLPPLADFDRRGKQRLARGTDTIDARLDLHGRTQSQAHAALLRFLRKAQADGAKTVLVITGKGDVDAEAGRGVLKRQVPLWLQLPEFRSLVVGFGDAGIGHGGAGALYVRIRRAR